jgi:hypothetical protein
MTYTVYRVERNGQQTVVACVDDLSEVGGIISEDRQKIDFEAAYIAEREDYGAERADS